MYFVLSGAQQKTKEDSLDMWLDSESYSFSQTMHLSHIPSPLSRDARDNTIEYEAVIVSPRLLGPYY